MGWEAPEGAEDLGYYIVEWQGKDWDTTLYSSPSTETSYTITHLYNDEYTVSVRTVSKEMLLSKGTTVKEMVPDRDDEEPTNITLRVENVLATSATFIWDNPTEDDFFKTVFELRSIDGDSIVLQDTLQSIDNRLSISGLAESRNYQYTFTTYDYIGNPSVSLVKEFKTLKEKQLDNKKAWKIEDFSSLQTSESTGKIEAVIDGDLSTFWHSQWSPSLPLPQYVVIDVKKTIKLAGVEIFKRNSTQGPTQIRLDGKLAWADKWTDLGTTTVDPKPLTGQNVNAQMVMDLQYVKVTVTGSTNGYAMLAEINVFELALE